MSPALVGRFSTTELPGKPPLTSSLYVFAFRLNETYPLIVLGVCEVVSFGTFMPKNALILLSLLNNRLTIYKILK